MKIKLANISEFIRVRFANDPAVVDDYADAMAEGAQFPPIAVFEHSKAGAYICADGGHRVEAALKNDFLDIEGELHKGTRADAIKFALGANVNHGYRPTPADKRVKVVLAFQELDPSITADREIARICGVSNKFVGDVRATLTDDQLKKVPDSRKEKRRGPPPPPAPKKKDEPTPPTPPAPKPPESKKKTAQAAEKDETGWPVTKEAMPNWVRRNEPKELASYLNDVKRRLERAQEENDILFSRLNYSDTIAHITQTITALKSQAPYAICPTCQGRNVDKCGECKGIGLLSKHYWDFVPENIRKMRESQGNESKS